MDYYSNYYYLQGGAEEKDKVTPVPINNPPVPINNPPQIIEPEPSLPAVLQDENLSWLITLVFTFIMCLFFLSLIFASGTLFSEEDSGSFGSWAYDKELKIKAARLIGSKKQDYSSGSRRGSQQQPLRR